MNPDYKSEFDITSDACQLDISDSAKKDRTYIYSDHKTLIHLNKPPKLNAKQAHWISFINLFNYTTIADALSRKTWSFPGRKAVAHKSD